ncbi:MAG TPA: hypothetical protein VMZ53_25185 [Kofleriaceae bacterium]|nr:hypothetical protein [Kofleriaceae bacterium]
MRWLPVLVVAGCAEPSAPAVPQVSVAPDVEQPTPRSPAWDPWAYPQVVPPKPPEPWALSTSAASIAEPAKRLVTSIHGASDIAVLAVTEDGRAAVTADIRSVRFWPRLDGKHEPVVVAMRPPAALAIARDGDGLLVAGLDAIGQLELVRLTADGESLLRVAAASARPIREIHATARGVIAVRDDDAIALYDAAGELRGELAPVARQRVRAVAVRHDAAIALVESGGTMHGQWLDVDATGVTRGHSTPALPFRDPAFALSTDHQRLVGTDQRGNVVVVDANTGRALQHRWKNKDDAALHVVGFIDRSALAIDVGAPFVALHAKRDFEQSEEIAGQHFVTVDGAVVGVEGAALVIGRHGKPVQYLGYRMASPITAVPRDDGFLITDGTALAELGPDLRARKLFKIAPKDGELFNTQLVDADHVVTAFAPGRDNPVGYVFADVSKGTVTPLGDGYASFSRENGLLAIQQLSRIDVRRYDRKQGKLGPASTLHVSSWVPFVWLDSKRGDFALVTLDFDARDAELDVFRLRDDVERLKTRNVKPAERWWDAQNMDTLLGETWRVSRRRSSPDGSLVAEVSTDGRMTLHDATGAERWMVASGGAMDVLWTPAGELVAFGAGIARVDIETGALRERQCGWQFGLWPASTTPISASALCEAP